MNTELNVFDSDPATFFATGRGTDVWVSVEVNPGKRINHIYIANLPNGDFGRYRYMLFPFEAYVGTSAGSFDTSAGAYKCEPTIEAGIWHGGNTFHVDCSDINTWPQVRAGAPRVVTRQLPASKKDSL